MSPRKAVVWRQVVDELTNALQVAVGFAAQVRAMLRRRLMREASARSKTSGWQSAVP
jgi:hypothetical protein